MTSALKREAKEDSMTKTKSGGNMPSRLYVNGEYAEKNPTYHVADSPWKAQQILKMIARQKLQAQSICEIGCGAGEILRQLQLHLSDTTHFAGYEVSPQAFELCRQRENERLHFFCEDLLLKDIEPFDILLCMDVVEHVEDYLGFLRKLRQKATYKIFHIPLQMSVPGVLLCNYLILRSRKDVGHIHYFMKETMLATLHDTGYEVVDWFYTPSGVERARNLMAKSLILPRKTLSLINQDLTVRLLGGYSLLVLAK
jgi:SAM-dependent methyltransferase